MKTGAAAVALILAGMFGPAAALADPLPIRVGWVVTPGHLAPLIEALGKREAGVFKHLGQSYVLQTTRFQGTTPQIQAQAIGDLDVAALSTAALALAITNAKLEERVVADVVADGVEGFFTENYVVAADSPIKTIEDIKGKRIATNAIGSASDAVGPTQAVLWGMRAETIAAHRPVFVDFFEDHIRAVRWFIDQNNREEALDILAGVTKLPKESLGFAFSKDDFYHSPDARPELDSVQREIDEAVKLGVLPQRVEIRPKHVDLSLIEEAKKRIDGK